MVVACQLVNLTHWREAKPVHEELVRSYRTARGLAASDTDELRGMLRPLWLQNQRARKLKLFAYQWVCCPPQDHVDLLTYSGCGKYASDSWAIFIEGIVPDAGVEDGKLSWYLNLVMKESC